MAFSVRSTGITLHLPAETIHIDAWGDGTIRVRAFVNEEPVPLQEGLVVNQPSTADVHLSSDGSIASVTTGRSNRALRSPVVPRPRRGLDGGILV